MTPQLPVEDLPLFAKQGAPPRPPSRPRVPAPAPAKVPAPAPPLPQLSRWRRPRAWLAIGGLALFVTGVCLLLPRGGDPEYETPTDALASLPTIVVDAGHGGHDSGAVRNGLREKDLTLDTALRLEKKLRAVGFPVVLTRRDDRFLALPARSAVANTIPRALFISIHFNDHSSATGEGVETFYASDKASLPHEGWTLAGLFRETPEPSPDDNGRAFAEAVQTSIVSAVKATDRGVKSAGLAVIRHARCPAVLVEGGFLSNPAQAKAISRPDYREKLAAAIAGGAADYQRQRTAELRKPKLAQAGP